MNKIKLVLQDSTFRIRFNLTPIQNYLLQCNHLFHLHQRQTESPPISLLHRHLLHQGWAKAGARNQELQVSHVAHKSQIT